MRVISEALTSYCSDTQCAIRPVRRTLLTGALFGLSLIVSGCISTTTVITVRPDGTGTIVETITMAAQMLTMFTGVVSAEAPPIARLDTLFPTPAPDEILARFGKGVRLVSSKPLDDSDRIGRMTTYSFDNIGNVRIDLRALETAGPSISIEPELQVLGEFTFEFVKEGPRMRKLTVREPRVSWGQSVASEAIPTHDTDDANVARSLARGAELAYIVELQGELLAQDGAQVSGNRVTLLAIDWETFLTDQKWSSRPPTPLQDVRDWLEGMPGVRLSPRRWVTMKFR